MHFFVKKVCGITLSGLIRVIQDAESCTSATFASTELIFFLLLSQPNIDCDWVRHDPHMCHFSGAPYAKNMATDALKIRGYGNYIHIGTLVQDSGKCIAPTSMLFGIPCERIHTKANELFAWWYRIPLSGRFPIREICAIVVGERIHLWIL